MRDKYLAVYDYGTGGVWTVVVAPSKDHILAKYPVLTAVDARPAWMSQTEYDTILSKGSFDLDSDPPTWLVAAMKEKQGA